MGKMKEFEIEQAAEVVAPEPVVVPEPEIEVPPVVSAAILQEEKEPVAVKVVTEVVTAKAPKSEKVSVGGPADEKVVVSGPLRGTVVALDGTSYLFTGNGVCAIERRHLEEFQKLGCVEF